MYSSASLDFTPKSFQVCKGHPVYINMLIKGSSIFKKKLKCFTLGFVFQLSIFEEGGLSSILQINHGTSTKW